MLPPPGLVQYPESLCESCDPSEEHAVPVGGIEKNFPPLTAVPMWKAAPPSPFRYTLSSAIGGITSCDDGGGGAGR